MSYLNVRQVADRLGVAPTTIYLLCARKVIPHVRIGVGRGVIRVPEAALTEFLERSAVQPDAPADPPAKPKTKLKHLRI